MKFSFSLAIFAFCIVDILLISKSKHYFYSEPPFFDEKIEPVTTANKGIPIAMALDDGYIYPTIVAINSIFLNINPKREYSFYIMVPPEFKEENKNKLRTLETKYRNCHLHFINMGNQFRFANDNGHITTPAYYRLALADLLPKVDKIIWLDSDTLILQDLQQMYDLDMAGNYYLGFLDNNINGLKRFKITTDHYICSGVLLIDLKLHRKDNLVKKFYDFIKANNNRLKQHDQTVINAVAWEKIGILPPKYGYFNYYIPSFRAKEYSDKLISKYKYTYEQLMAAQKDLCVLHYVDKPWISNKYPLSSLWWTYAAKTDFYNEMMKIL